MKKNKKRLWRVVAVLMAVLILTLSVGCGLGSGVGGNSAVWPEDTDHLKVVTTIFPAYDFARQIGGGSATVKMLLAPGEELHSYEPSPRDIIAIEQCNVFIYVGGESDTWVEDVLESIDTSRITIISMMELVEALEEETVEGMESGSHDHDHEHDEDCGHETEADGGTEDAHEHDEDCGHESEADSDADHDHHSREGYDEHVWTSPLNAKLVVEAIADRFCELDPENELTYRSNEKTYLAALDELADDLLEIRENAARTTIIVGDRFPFLYLAKFMQLEYYAAFPGCAEETEPSAKTVAFLIDKVKEEQIPVVFYGEFSSHLMADRISEEAGAAALLLHSCHNVTKAEFEAGVTYLDLMRQNVENLRRALQ